MREAAPRLTKNMIILSIAERTLCDVGLILQKGTRNFTANIIDTVKDETTHSSGHLGR